ncbi:MAG: hypothetical protein II942_03950 [Alphaproteobacteria bacterium]|nr:hypothetical protein [Alphaproteobacteria bacterium]
MTRYELARKQVKARKNGNQGMFMFLLAVGGLYVAGSALSAHLGSLHHSMRGAIKMAIQKGASVLAKDDVQKVVEDVSEVSINQQQEKERERD